MNVLKLPSADACIEKCRRLWPDLTVAQEQAIEETVEYIANVAHHMNAFVDKVEILEG
jgi:hypothetical protein